MWGRKGSEPLTSFCLRLLLLHTTENSVILAVSTALTLNMAIIGRRIKPAWPQSSPQTTTPRCLRSQWFKSIAPMLYSMHTKKSHANAGDMIAFVGHSGADAGRGKSDHTRLDCRSGLSGGWYPAAAQLGDRRAAGDSSRHCSAVWLLHIWLCKPHLSTRRGASASHTCFAVLCICCCAVSADKFVVQPAYAQRSRSNVCASSHVLL